MAKVLIEDIARAMEQDPAQLTALQSRKYCILIDLALVMLNASKLEDLYTPRLKQINIDDEQRQQIIDTIAKALKAGEFKELDLQNPKSEMLDNMREQLGKYLGCSQATVDKIIEDAGFISDYEREIKKNGFVYTESLSYQPRFDPNDIDVKNQNKNLKLAYDKLKVNKLFTANVDNIITENSNMQLCVNQIESLSAAKRLAPSHASELIIFYLEIIKSLNAIHVKQNVSIYEEDIKKLLNNITPLIEHISPTSDNQEAVLKINLLLRAILPKDKKAPLQPKIAKMLSQMMVNHPVLRNFQTLGSIDKNAPIDRVILLGSEDLADQEVMTSLEVLLKKHPNENIIVTFDVADVTNVNTRNASVNKTFTLHAIGHGSVAANQKMNANIGPYRGDAAMVGNKISTLVNACGLIDHVRITGCFSGLMRENANLDLLREKKHVNVTMNEEYRRTLTLVTDSDLNDTNSPFLGSTVAVSCWNGIDKSKRQISMTVSPGIIEPDKEFGRMMWKSSPGVPSEQHGIKEVRVTTSEGPKNKLKY